MEQVEGPIAYIVDTLGIPTFLRESYDRESFVFICLVVLAMLIGLCTILGKYLSEQDRVTRSRQIIARIKDIGMPNFPITQGVPIFYNGVVSVVGSPADPDFEIVTMDQPILKRTVKVLCWKEIQSDCFHKDGELVGSGKSYRYKKVWIDSKEFIDSKNFNDKSYQVNIRPPEGIESETFYCSTVRVGPFRVNHADVEKAFNWKKFTEPFKYENPVARVDPDGIWSYDEHSCSLIRQKMPGQDTVGDLEVSYEVLDDDFDTKREVMMSACGIGDGDTLQPFDELTTSVCEGYTGKKDFVKKYVR